MDIDWTNHLTMAAERTLIDLLRKIFHPLGVHLPSLQEKLSEPGITDRPIFGGLQSIECSDPLIIGHHKDWALLNAFTATGAAINFDQLFKGEF
jgi:hypothetical protein